MTSVAFQKRRQTEGCNLLILCSRNELREPFQNDLFYGTLSARRRRGNLTREKSFSSCRLDSIARSKFYRPLDLAIES